MGQWQSACWQGAIPACQRTFETTLATRRYANWLSELRASGYQVRLLFLWLPSAEMAVARVAQRVRRGGHDVPEPTIRWRYAAGLANLHDLYLPLADSWQVIDNTNVEAPRVLAAGKSDGRCEVFAPEIWNQLSKRAELA